MREIKFRAWSIVFNVIGNVTSIDFINDRVRFCYNGIVESNFDCCILMQYTGLKDKNGKEIYEGDIVKDPMKYPHSYTHRLGNNQIGEVFFDTCLGGWFIRTLPEYDDLALGEFNSDKHEIIGNVYENPELLK